MTTSNKKTPLGYFEKAIAELRDTQQELQAELEELRKFKQNYVQLAEKLESTTQELQAVKAELENIKTNSQQTNKQIEEVEHQNQQNIDAVKTGIENGSIVAQKAVMLRGVDNEHWMGFCKLDAVNHHCLRVWKSSDNTWHDDIRVKASFFLRARDNHHWMGCVGEHHSYDVFRVWKSDNSWQSSIRVRAARHIYKG
ncbi:MAG: hypothetical protein QNJ51_03005 [Calothrix sp. MO_167.B12]|nr:hypothetical protein [Calothrix sp. MO_167.B12]